MRQDYDDAVLNHPLLGRHSCLPTLRTANKRPTAPTATPDERQRTNVHLSSGVRNNVMEGRIGDGEGEEQQEQTVFVHSPLSVS